MEIRLSTHDYDHEVRATLVHEMAHAATNRWHGARWHREMVRLREQGAPAEALDFMVPYTNSVRNLITSFIDYAKAGANWEEELAELGDWKKMQNPRVVRRARYFFALNSRSNAAGR